MNRLFTVAIIILLLGGCQSRSNKSMVDDIDQLTDAIRSSRPGNEIVMKNGVWKDVKIRFVGTGTESNPIVLRAETPGKVFIEGVSDLKFGGEYLKVSGLHFRNGYTPSNAVVEFRLNSDTLANNCRITQCVIEDFNQPSRDKADRWVQFWGRHNQMDRCYLAGKSNRGPTVRVDIQGNESIRNFHQIVNNHFGTRLPKGGPSAETIQLGVSSTSMSPSNTLVANNFFEECNGEVEVISSKTNYNEFRNNVFYKSEGSLVMRHGNYCIVDGNYFIGDKTSNYMGGIRIINTGHWVTNNYFINLKGTEFRSPLAIMNGIPRSPLNRYNQVTDVVVAHNTWINCKSPWQLGVGSNVSQKDVLPPSEIRSARPIRTLVANNIIFNKEGDPNPIVTHDEIDGIEFRNNLIDNNGQDFNVIDGLEVASLEFTKLTEDILAPSESISDFEPYDGFDFENITEDLFGYTRSQRNVVGAINQPQPTDPGIMDKGKYGPDWYSIGEQQPSGTTLQIKSGIDDLRDAVSVAGNGDIIELEGIFEIDESLAINKRITVKSKGDSKAEIVYTGTSGTPAFEMHPKGRLNLENIKLSGMDNQLAFASLMENMSSSYELSVSDCEISGFDYITKAYKQSFAQEISFSNSVLRDSKNGIELSAETNDRGDYNAEKVVIDNCQFQNIDSNVIDYYRGGYDESTVGGTLFVVNSSFTNCGGSEENGILLNTYGIINVNLVNNVFKNNPVELVAMLWGAKNNRHSGNEIINSGKIVVEENLRLKLMY